MTDTPKGTLIIIGGHEEKNGHRPILTEVASRARRGKGRIAVITVASQEPEEMAKQYRAVFADLGVKQVDVIDVRTRNEAHDPERVSLVEQSNVVFFTGGDQLRITSQVGDSPLYRCIRDIYHHGGTIVGTSAGAAAMPETMLVSGPSDTSNEISAVGLAPGLGLLPGTVIDSHFAQRGRIGRLVGVVAQNPRNLGIGIDEDTAIVVNDSHFSLLGSGAVYVIDGTEISYSSLSEEHPEGVLSVYNVRTHILSNGDRFDLSARTPISQSEANT
jgi:cyanophycinase